MEEIKRLDQNTINKIAAGEVVERPSAVVKELVENAIDAGANAITVEIKGGGVDLIRITDNGSGIAKEQVKLAFQRHATSKIRVATDLLSVCSLGFRGEALASIGAVAQVEVLTKTRGAFTGVRYAVDGGEERAFEDIGCPDGTTFLVRNLFYNVPARKKFLKSAQTEASYISDLVERLAISRPNISFKFMNNNQLKLQTSGNGNSKDVIYHVYGRDITAQLVEVKAESDVIGISGFVAKPVVNRGNRNYMNYFINGRYIKSAIINKAIEEAYKPYMMQHRYPMTALQFSLDTQYIDVNVHPTKMEIRFTNGQAVYQAVYEAVSDALSGRNMIPSVTIGKEKKPEKVPAPKSAPEPFEQKRKAQELAKAAPGRQKVEAARALAQLETVTPKQPQPSRAFVKSEISSQNLNPSPFGQKIQVQPQKTDGESAVSPQEQLQKTEEQTVLQQKLQPKDSSEQMPEEPKGSVKNQEQPNKIQETSPYQSKRPVTPTPAVAVGGSAITAGTPVQETLFTKENEAILTKDAKKHHKIIGQVFQTYWIVQYKDEMLIIDQHAAHEKVLFEKTMRTLEQRKTMSQILQPPVILSLSMREQQALQKFKPQLEQLGFEIEAFGGREFSVRAVPANLFGVGEIELLTELIDSLTDEINIKNSDMILEKVASMSCKAAVKGNMKLSFQEAEALIDELLELENPYHCPHGRPVIVSMSKYELEKKFKRIL